jgi:hypothetical protein
MLSSKAWRSGRSDRSLAIGKVAALRALGDTHGVMPEESTTPEPVELARRVKDAGNRRDIDEVLSFFAPRRCLDISPMDLGIFEGRAAIRRFLEDGCAHTMTSCRRPRRFAISLMVDDSIARPTSYTDIDEARAAAEPLAQERG